MSRWFLFQDWKSILTGDKYTAAAARYVLRQRNMTFSACLWRIKGVSLHMTRYIRRYGERMPMEMKATLSAAISATCGRNCTRQSRMRLLQSGACGRLGIALRLVLNKGLYGGLVFQAVLFYGFCRGLISQKWVCGHMRHPICVCNPMKRGNQNV